MSATHDAPDVRRTAGPLALVADALMVVAELAMWPFDPKDHVATTRSVVFQVAGAVYFVGFCVLLLALFAAYLWQASEAGRLGAAGMAVAAVGTMALGGDLWFESFAVPWLADEAPAAFDTEPTVVLALGAVSSYLLFAVGWVLFGLASLRARVFPRVLGVALVVSGVCGFQALLAPFGLPLGLTMVGLGGWMVVSRRRRPRRWAHPPGSSHRSRPDRRPCSSPRPGRVLGFTRRSQHRDRPTPTCHRMVLLEA